MLEYQFRPIDVWPRDQNRRYLRASFSAPWSKTLDLLERELRHLGAKHIVIQACVGMEDIRNDGMLRANAKPHRPGIILSFDSKHGPLAYPCDTFDDWQANVRAIALALEALRAVDRYGVTRRAEQYRGWQQLPPPSAATGNSGNPFRDRPEAITFLRRLLGVPSDKNPSVESLLLQAEMKTHPDRGGDSREFKIVQYARERVKT